MGGGVLTLVLFLWALRFRPLLFLSDLAHHAATVRPSLSDLPRELGFQLTNGYAEILNLPIYSLVVVGWVLLAIRWKKIALPVRWVVAILSVGFVVNVILYSRSMQWSALFFGAAATSILAATWSSSRRWRRASLALVFLLFVVHESYVGLDWLADIRSPSSRPGEVEARLCSLSAGVVAVDEVAARRVFDYRLPAGAVAWNFAEPWPEVWPRSVREKPRHQVWVISAAKATACAGLPPSRRFELAGHRFQSIPADRREILVVP